MYDISRVQVLAELTNRERQVLIPGFCLCFFVHFPPAALKRAINNQTTKYDRRTTRKLRSSVC